MEWNKYLPFFRPEEFDSKGENDPPGTGINMNEHFMDMLYASRVLSQRIDPSITWIITSGYRTQKHNKKVSTSDNSPHLRGVAADIFVDTPYKRYIILSCLLKAGFKRIGIGNDFLHCDCDTVEGKTHDIIWLYEK